MTPSTLLVAATVLFFVQKWLNLFTEWVVSAIIRFSPEFSKLRELKVSLYNTTLEKNSVSPQDAYAKWTKLNRSIDKLSADITAQEGLLLAKRDQYKSFGTVLSRLVLFSSYGIKLWFRKTKVFHMPNVFPIPVLQWAWASGVGVSVWLFLLGSFVSGVEFIVGELVK